MNRNKKLYIEQLRHPDFVNFLEAQTDEADLFYLITRTLRLGINGRITFDHPARTIIVTELVDGPN